MIQPKRIEGNLVWVKRRVPALFGEPGPNGLETFSPLSRLRHVAPGADGQENPDLVATNWVTVTNVVAVVGNEKEAVLSLSAGHGFTG